MRTTTLRHGRALAAIVLASTLLGALALATRAGDEASASQELKELFASDWSWTMEQWPTWASELGDRRWNDRWEDVSEAAFARRNDHARATLAHLAKIEAGELSPEDELDARLFRRGLEEGLEEFDLDLYLLRIDQQGGIQNRDDLASSLRFETVKDYEDWLARLVAFKDYAAQEQALLAKGASKGVILPKVVLARVPAQLEKQIVGDPEKSPFFAPFKSFPATISEADRTRILAKAREAIATSVVPAYKKFLAFFKDEYLPKGYDQVGIWQMPEGAKKYAFSVRRHTTTNRTPREIHETGLAEVKRIRGELEALARTASPGKSYAEYRQFLRSDPQFFARTPEELLTRYRALAKRIDPLLVKLFRTLPRTPYGVEPIPDAMAPDSTTAYYRGPAADGSRAGTYFVNLYKPETRPLWEMTAAHAPRERPRPPPADRPRAGSSARPPGVPAKRGFTAFVEGWGLYAESLGDDMGLYDDRLREVRPADVRDVARRPPRRRHGDARHALEPAKGHRLLPREHRQEPRSTSPTRSTATSRGRDRRWPTRRAS